MNIKVVMLGFAGLCGLGAFYGTTRFLKKDTPKVEMVDVLVAARDLKIEEVINPEIVKIVKMEAPAVPPGSLTSVKEAEGRWVQLAMLEGEPIIDKKLAEKGSPPGLISKIPKGMQGYAVDVTEQSGVSGFILPDHRVDVFQSVSKPNGQNEAFPVLQDVLVLASGTTFTRPEDRSIQSRTVTLAVTPEQVGILVAAKAGGSLSLSLRGLNDHTHYDIKPKTPVVEEKLPAVLVTAPEPPPPAPEPPPPPPPAPKPQVVVVYKGIDNMSRVLINQGNQDTGLSGPDAGKEPPDENLPASIAGSLGGSR